MTDGPLRKSLARAVIDKLSNASCLQEIKIQDLLVMARVELERFEPPRQNPGMCGTKHPWIQSIWQYGGRGEPLCGKCGHIEGGDCHQPPYNDMLGGCSWCGILATKSRHGIDCPFTLAETKSVCNCGPEWCPPGECLGQVGRWLLGSLYCTHGNTRTECQERHYPESYSNTLYPPVHIELREEWSEHLMRDVREALPTGYRIEMATPHRVQVVDECGCIVADLTDVGYRAAAHQNSVEKLLRRVREYVQAKTARDLSEVDPRVVTGRLSTKESNLSNLPQCCPVDCWIAHEHTLVRQTPCYWEDVVAKRLQAKLPPGYIARPIRKAPLRDEDAKVQIRDSEGIPYAVFEYRQDYRHEDGIIKRAWKRFLDKGV